MKIYVQQTIQIHSIKIEGMSNSSVFQIGTSGQIQPVSNLYNTGGYTEPAPEPEKNGETAPVDGGEVLVPLSSPTAG
ncbi:spore germination protein GerPB [Bacillus seohaeanensis]|jgi:spore germination protein PB|uniref:Spore germination protein GerPB n=1 Tax=Bacillus seohaeanensis TaxID=284580 RepID=A0ABW5RS41_9BACI